MARKEKQKAAIAQVMADMQKELPDGEQLIGYIDAYKRSTGMYLLLGIFSFLLGDHHRKYGIGFSDKRVIFVGYSKTSNYEPVHFWCRPFDEVKVITRGNVYGKLDMLEITSKNYADKNITLDCNPRQQDEEIIKQFETLSEPEAYNLWFKRKK